MKKHKYFREDEVHWDVIIAVIVFVLILGGIFLLFGIISDLLWYGSIQTW